MWHSLTSPLRDNATQELLANIPRGREVQNGGGVRTDTEASEGASRVEIVISGKRVEMRRNA